MQAEFDEYSARYDELLKDPIRDGFSADPLFFHKLKWDLIERWTARRGVDLGHASWLDIGCGQGELLRLGRKSVGRAIGCDLSEGMLRNCEGVETRVQEAPDRLPAEDGSIDFATAVCVFHHVELATRPTLVREIRRVLRPGGVFCLIEHNPWNPVTQLIVHRTPVDADARLLSAPRSRRMLRSDAFEPIDLEYFLYFPEKLRTTLGGLEPYLTRVPLGGQYAFFARAV